MLFMICMNLIMMICELYVGVSGNCLSMIADSFNLISDAIGLVVGFTAIMLGKRSTNPFFTYGWKRSEVIGAFFNASFLISSSFFLITQIVNKFIEPENLENIDLVLYVGIAGLLENMLGVIMINDFKCFHCHNGKKEKNKKDVERLPLTEEGRENQVEKKQKDMAVHSSFLIIL